MNARIMSERSTWILALVFFAVTNLGAAPDKLDSDRVTVRANGKIAFTSDRDGNLEIYVMDNDGSRQVRLTYNTTIDSLPAFSPDGRRIAYFSQETPGSPAGSIKVMNADGTNPRVVTPITLHGLQFPLVRYEYSALSWSPDGGKIAFDDEGEIFTINADGSDRRNITNQPGEDIAPAWSRYGSRIVFTSSRFGYSTMHTMRPDGTDVQMLPSWAYWWDVSPDWSPAGDKVIFVELSEDWHPRILMANADGSNRQVFDGTGMGFSGERNIPKWSPDGAKVVFQHWKYPEEDCEIYVKNANGGIVQQLTNSVGNNAQPSWQVRPPISPISIGTSFDQ